ncbi:CLUMA_CG010489, isoform A [Clunio marinus]|uniref:CLUMA_CG010489, isoform A n=1 Tax=Clunio marinus TaxID=568069 RepID=A0A1J1IBY1_9DIPT|nr:CLUMA_CG010489, isoform A [Clunio marinus]
MKKRIKQQSRELFESPMGKKKHLDENGGKEISKRRDEMLLGKISSVQFSRSKDQHRFRNSSYLREKNKEKENRKVLWLLRIFCGQLKTFKSMIKNNFIDFWCEEV